MATKRGLPLGSIDGGIIESGIELKRET